MLTNLLSQLPEGGKEVGIGEASLYALIGFLVVFAGIAFLIFVVWLVGKIMTAVNGKNTKKSKKEKDVVAPAIPQTQNANVEEISEETVAVITAALMAYYQKVNPKCEFTVRRIKRL